MENIEANEIGSHLECGVETDLTQRDTRWSRSKVAGASDR